MLLIVRKGRLFLLAALLATLVTFAPESWSEFTKRLASQNLVVLSLVILYVVDMVLPMESLSEMIVGRLFFTTIFIVNVSIFLGGWFILSENGTLSGSVMVIASLMALIVFTNTIELKAKSICKEKTPPPERSLE